MARGTGSYWTLFGHEIVRELFADQQELTIPNPHKSDAIQIVSWQTFMLRFDEGEETTLKGQADRAELGTRPAHSPHTNHCTSSILRQTE